ncbi:NAD(P)-dependent oxidoreductase [Kitasatospora sp. McL0602]|uniref:NAD(P)-dependent oxidoreductase n=1 Tax=Kitasatospora sp. McL0602 TaxID=3439530 RepID=UPI003F891FF8
MERIAVVGLGAMGAPIARRLLGQGCEVTVWNRSPERGAAPAEAGATVAGTPADAARGAEAVIVMVSDPDALREVTEGGHGIAAGAGPGSVVVQMSTVSPAAVTRLARVLPPGVEVLDAPVLGSVGEAAAGELRILVGGPQALVDRCRPLLERLGSPLHLGAVGAGTAAKLVANNVLFGVLGVLGESLALGGALGLRPDALYEALGVTPLAAQAERRRPAVEAADYPARFALALARKDADLVAAAADKLGLDLGLTAAARAWLAGAEQAGRAGQDYSAVLAHILEQATKEVRR